MTILQNQRSLRFAPRTATGTLCLFRGPTPWIDPARKLVTPLDHRIRHMADDGQKVQWWDAGMVHRALMAEVGVTCNGLDNCCLVHDKTIQHSRDGIKMHTLMQETPVQRYLRRLPEWYAKAEPFQRKGFDPFDEEPLADLDLGYVYDEAPQGLWVSPSLYDEVGDYFGAEAFPESFDFGNGATCNSWVPLRVKGEVRPTLLCWAVMPSAVVDRYGRDTRFWERMQRCVEGGQTGVAIPKPAPPPPECPAVLEGGDHWWKYIDHEIPNLRGCRVCGAFRVGDRTVTIQANHIELSTGGAPVNPGGGLVRWYSTGDTAADMRSSGGTVTALAGGGAAGAVTREGGNLTEATTVSTVAVDLLTAATLTIAAAEAALVLNRYRKTSGAANAAAFGAKLNATIVAAPINVANDTRNVFGGTAASNQAEDGQAHNFIPSTVITYTEAGIIGQYCSFFATGQAQSNIGTTSNTAGRPDAQVTDVIIRALVGSASITGGADELNVYSFANA